MKAPQHLLLDKGYQAAKERLVRQGYMVVAQATGLIPFVFVRGETRLYLFRAALDGRCPYVVELTDDSLLRPVQLGGKQPLLFIPAAEYAEPELGRVRYHWLPRRLEQAPLLYRRSDLLTKLDISEFLGVSMATVHYASRQADGVLRPTMRLGETPLYTVESVLTWNDQRARGARPRTSATRSHANYTMCKEVLVTRLERHIERGKVRDLAKLRGDIAAHVEIEYEGISGLLLAAGRLQRKTLLDILVDHAVLAREAEPA